MPTRTIAPMRMLLGDVLRERRQGLGLTLREVSELARISLGYISEIERGHKEPSSELLSALAGALESPLSLVLRDVADRLALEEGSELATVSHLVETGATAGNVRASAA